MIKVMAKPLPVIQLLPISQVCKIRPLLAVTKKTLVWTFVKELKGTNEGVLKRVIKRNKARRISLIEKGHQLPLQRRKEKMRIIIDLKNSRNNKKTLNKNVIILEKVRILTMSRSWRVVVVAKKTQSTPKWKGYANLKEMKTIIAIFSFISSLVRCLMLRRSLKPANIINQKGLKTKIVEEREIETAHLLRKGSNCHWQWTVTNKYFKNKSRKYFDSRRKI